MDRSLLEDWSMLSKYNCIHQFGLSVCVWRIFVIISVFQVTSSTSRYLAGIYLINEYSTGSSNPDFNF